MRAIIIAIGDEILIGQVLDSNSNFISKNLYAAGVEVLRIMAIKDDPDQIVKSLNSSFEEVDMVVLTGGLGPTKDDLTKHTLCAYFDDHLVFVPEVMTHIEEMFKKIGRIPSELNRGQAMLPSRSVILHNQFGTAPGMIFKNGGKVVVSLPGVPFEMKALVQDKLLPWIEENLITTKLFHKTILTYGLPESELAQKISYWEDNLPSGMKLAYLPNPGRVRLRLSMKGSDKPLMESAIAKQVELLNQIIPDNIFGYDDQSIEELISSLLISKSLSISVAESFTGGRLSTMLTSVPGSSKYFKGSVVCYSSQSKIELLGVDKSLIDNYTAVSKEVALAMAIGCKNKFNTDIAIATTGVAGPDKGEDKKDVGTAIISIVGNDFEIVEEYNFGQPREKMQGRALSMALDLLRKKIGK